MKFQIVITKLKQSLRKTVLSDDGLLLPIILKKPASSNTKDIMTDALIDKWKHFKLDVVYLSQGPYFKISNVVPMVL